MDNELEKIWKSYISSDKLPKIKSGLEDLRQLPTPINLKAKILDSKPVSSPWSYKLVPIATICLVVFLLFPESSKHLETDDLQLAQNTITENKETQELEAVLSFYLEDDNFNFTLSDLSILEEEKK